MKAYLILINWTLSFMGLTMGTNNNPTWAVAAGVAWFAISSMLLLRADRKGTMDKLNKHFNTEEK
jgi:hypothetical protein